METIKDDNNMNENAQPVLAMTPRTTPMSLCKMPPEVLMHLAYVLPCREFGRLLQTSRYIHDTIDTHWIWHRRFTARFGQTILEPLVHSRTPTPPPPDVTNTTTEPGADPVIQENAVNASTSSPTLSSTLPSSTAGHNLAPSLSDEENDEAKKPSSAKGKHKRVDLRRTTEVSKEDLVELYKRHSRTKLPAADLDICHMGDRYWKMIDSIDSQFGHLAELRSVWWMDVVGVFRGVPPGRYRIR
ncbi:hypothetical protein BGZ94_001157, partial [Podila epigama]